MPRARNDTPKRKMAQTLNHLANAVIDMNDVYTMFDESIQRMRDAAVSQGIEENKEGIERYQQYKERLKSVMMEIVIPREEIVKLIGEMWELDEETIKVYLG